MRPLVESEGKDGLLYAPAAAFLLQPAPWQEQGGTEIRGG